MEADGALKAHGSMPLVRTFTRGEPEQCTMEGQALAGVIYWTNDKYRGVG